MNSIVEKIERFMDLGGLKKDIILLAISGVALLISIFDFSNCPLMPHGSPCCFAVCR